MASYLIMKKIIPVYFFLFPTLSYAFCFNEAGKEYNVNPDLLEAIALKESSLIPNAVGYNKDEYTGEVSSTDYGLMQINSWWFGKFSEDNVNERTVMEPCFNVKIGARILSLNFSSHGFNWNSVGAYNAGFKESGANARKAYILEIKKNLRKLRERKKSLVDYDLAERKKLVKP